MSNPVAAHLRHHARFYIAALAGTCIWGLAATYFPAPLRFSIAGDSAYAIYLVLMFVNMIPLKPEHLRKRSDYEDEGIVIIFVITLVAVALSVGNIFVILNSGNALPLLQLALALGGVLLGWLTLHVVMAAHYIHVFYTDARSGKIRTDVGGLEFPGTKEPAYWDFLYYSFVIGMTAQTSDTDVTSTRMRRLSLGHGMVSFFYNTVLIALAVNIVVNLAK